MVVVSEKLPKIPVFGPSLIHQLQLLVTQLNPQSGVPLTSFSTWGTENSNNFVKKNYCLHRPSR
jgi:hypothetical protein